MLAVMRYLVGACVTAVITYAIAYGGWRSYRADLSCGHAVMAKHSPRPGSITKAEYFLFYPALYIEVVYVNKTPAIILYRF